MGSESAQPNRLFAHHDGTCMNDRGDGAAPDPLFNSSYSSFCYELPYMPGQTGYFDTPVCPPPLSRRVTILTARIRMLLPLSAEWMAMEPGRTMGKCGWQVPYDYKPGQLVGRELWILRPSATAAPFNAKTVQRTMAFGANAQRLEQVHGGFHVTIGEVNATITGWSDLQLPSLYLRSAKLRLQQQAQYRGSNAKCGQLVITSGNGKQPLTQ